MRIEDEVVWVSARGDEILVTNVAEDVAARCGELRYVPRPWHHEFDHIIGKVHPGLGSWYDTQRPVAAQLLGQRG